MTSRLALCASVAATVIFATQASAQTYEVTKLVPGSAFHGGLVVGMPHGAALISGGSFGPEASVLAILIGVVASALMLRRATRKGNLVRAPWRNR